MLGSTAAAAGLMNESSRQRNSFVHEEDGDVLPHGVEIFSIGTNKGGGDFFVQDTVGAIAVLTGGNLLI